MGMKKAFDNTDINLITGLGYQIHGCSTAAFIRMMNNEYRNFDLLSLLRCVETHFSPTTEHAINRFIFVDIAQGKLQICYFNDPIAGADDELSFVRTFLSKNGKISVFHDRCVLPVSHRNKGLIKPVFAESLRQYLAMGASSIYLTAGLANGGYMWAKIGFAAVNKEEVQSILKSARIALRPETFIPVNKIFDGYYQKHPNGKSFPIYLWAEIEEMKPILTAHYWEGVLDLQNEKQLTKFTYYVSG